MEWILQVVDEIDDAFGALRLWSLGAAAEIGLVGPGLKIHGSQVPTSR
jgi:hypothetical protein